MLTKIIRITSVQNRQSLVAQLVVSLTDKEGNITFFPFLIVKNITFLLIMRFLTQELTKLFLY